jgi:hypothetical protein
LVDVDLSDPIDRVLHSRHKRSPSTPGSRPDSFQTMALQTAALKAAEAA